MGEHSGSKQGDERECLGMEVVKHGVRAPAAKEADNVSVNVATQHGHGTSCLKAVTSDNRRDASAGAEGLPLRYEGVL
jgi:hypothetical protein